MKKSRVRLIVNLLIGAVFVAFAYLQVNDIDPEVYVEASSGDALLWAAFYALVAALFIVGAFAKRIPIYLLLVGAAFCAFQMATTFGGVYDNLFKQDEFTITGSQMSPDRSHVELSREFFGAAIALTALGFLWFQQRRKPANPEPS